MARRLIYCLLSIVTLQSFANEYEYACVEASVQSSPFFVSDEYRQGDRIYENLRSVDNPGEVNEYLPRESLVQIEPELYEFSDDVNYRVPVKVISVPSEKREESAKGTSGKYADGQLQKKRFRHTVAGANKLSRAVKGSVGFIHKRSLKKVSDQIFILEKDAPVFKTPGGDEVKAMAMKFDMDGDKFQIKRCCLLSDEEICFDSYKISFIDKELNELSSYYIDPFSCGYFKGAHPVEEEVADGVLPILEKMQEEMGREGFSIGDLELLSSFRKWRGSKPYTQRPMLAKFPFDFETGLGPYNTFHYKPDDKFNSDAYMHPTSQCAFMSALKEFEKTCPSDKPGCLVQIGNMYHHDDWKSHVSHDSGYCVDIRPMRNDNTQDYASGLTFRSKGYSRERSKDLINAIYKAGGSKLFFNDSKIGADKKPLRDRTGVHDNHIHVCFDPNSRAVKDACHTK